MAMPDAVQAGLNLLIRYLPGDERSDDVSRRGCVSGMSNGEQSKLLLDAQYNSLEASINRFGTLEFKKGDSTVTENVFYHPYSVQTNNAQWLEGSVNTRGLPKAAVDAEKRRQAKEIIDQELSDLFASLNGSLASIERRLRDGSQLEPADLYELVNVLVGHQQTLGFRFQSVRDRAEQLDNELDSSANSDHLSSPEVTAAKNKIEDVIVAYLMEVESILTRALGSAERVHKFLSDKLVLDKVRHETYRYYYYLPVVLLVAMWTAIIGLEVSSSSSASYWVTVLRVMRGPLLTLTFMYLVGLNISGWAKVRINYVKLFSIKYVRAVTPKDAFRFAGLVTVVFGVLLFVVMFASADGSVVPLLVVGVAMWLVLILLMANPLKLMQRGARFSFVSSFARVTLTPFYAISFGDAWLADQMLSTIAVMLDFEYLICYLSVVIWNPDTDKSVCLSSRTGIRPIIVALPAIWRLLQCLRSYYDTTSSKQLLNAGKYMSALPVIAFSTAYELAPSRSLSSLIDSRNGGWIVFGWVITAAVNILYSFLWDVFCDWKLIQFASGHLPHLRRQRLYGRKEWYMLIIPLDFILRVLSTLKLTFTIVRNVPHSETIFTFLIFSEFLRRFGWNFFRVEVESLHNATNEEKVTPTQLHDMSSY